MDGSSPGHDRGEVPTASGAISAKREEARWIRVSASGYDVHEVGIEPERHELVDGNLGEHNVGFVPRAALHDVQRRGASSKLGGHVFGHLECSGGNVRSNGRDQIAIVADAGAKGAYSGFDDPENEPFPPRVDGRDCAASAIRDEHRKAIRYSDADCSLRILSHDCITFELCNAVARLRSSQDDRLTSVHLREIVEALGCYTKRLGGAPDVFRHSAGLVSDRDREIERSIGTLRHSSPPGEERMTESGRFEDRARSEFRVIAWQAAGLPT